MCNIDNNEIIIKIELALQLKYMKDIIINDLINDKFNIVAY